MIARLIQIFPQLVYCNEEAGKFKLIFGWTSHYALISRFYGYLNNSKLKNYILSNLGQNSIITFEDLSNKVELL